MRAYEVPVFNYVLRLVGDRSLAEDLTQEVFLRVYQGLAGFSLRSRFTTWLFQVTKNRVLDELRAVERRPRAVVARCLEPDPADRPASAAELGRELRLAVEPATEPLPARSEAPTAVFTRPRRRLRRRLVAPAIVFLAAIAVAVAVVLATRGGGSSPPIPPSVQPVPHSTNPAQQARNLADWLRRYSR